jgi:hypothetical protein
MSHGSWNARVAKSFAARTFWVPMDTLAGLCAQAATGHSTAAAASSSLFML